MFKINPQVNKNNENKDSWKEMKKTVRRIHKRKVNNNKERN